MTNYKDLIESLRSYSTEVISYKIDGAFAYAVTAAADAIEQLVRERDAAVADLKMLSDCRTCKNNNTKHFDCMGYEWRELEDRK